MTITKDMTLNDIIALDRGSAAVMMEYGMSCIGCPYSMMESLEMACSAHGVDSDELLDALNEYFENKEDNENKKGKKKFGWF